MKMDVYHFKLITGIDHTHFWTNIRTGDDWGNFLKIASVIEASSKRAIALKNKIDPDSDAIRNISFSSSLKLCKEMKVISKEAFEFANYIRLIRNDVIHNGGVLNLDMARLTKYKFFKKHEKNISDFINVREYDSLKDMERQMSLILGCTIVFLVIISKSLEQASLIPEMT